MPNKFWHQLTEIQLNAKKTIQSLLVLMMGTCFSLNVLADAKPTPREEMNQDYKNRGIGGKRYEIDRSPIGSFDYYMERLDATKKKLKITKEQQDLWADYEKSLIALFTDIKRGEVVVFGDPDNWLGSSAESEDSGVGAVVKTGLITVGVLPDPAKQYLIKRVIGVGGDKVVCCDKAGKVQVNGVSITEPYIFAGDKPSDMQFNVDIPKGFIWVMGDHRGASADSRFHPDSANNGMVPLSKVVGRAVFVVWPFTDIGLIPKGEDLKKIPVKNLP